MKIAVLGTSGAGKTTLCQQLADTLKLPYTEIDALHWKENWEKNPNFTGELEKFLDQDCWTIEWQYHDARQMIATRADTFIYLNFSKAVTTSRVVQRTIARRFGRQTLFNDNTEGPLSQVLTDKDHIIRWSWKSHPKYQKRWEELKERYPDKNFVEFKTPRAAKAWMLATQLTGRVQGQF